MSHKNTSEGKDELPVYGTFQSDQEQLLPSNKSVYDEVTELGTFRLLFRCLKS